jgi:cell division septation protein DedD
MVTATNAAEGTGHYVVQVSSQRSEADAQASYKALQQKYASVLGGHDPIIRRADLGDKGTFYRAQVGPFATMDEATQLCNSLKSAGGQCIIQRN